MSLNGKIIESFNICHRMRQGYLLIPYFFLLVDEALYWVTKAVVTFGELFGISLVDGIIQQALLQYGDGTSYMCDQYLCHN